jgi:transcriptional regulator with XRE-family HTH domain
MSSESASERATGGEKLRSWRKKAGLSQEALATATGASRKIVQSWEHGTAPPVDVVPALADALGIDVVEIVEAWAPANDAAPTATVEPFAEGDVGPTQPARDRFVDALISGIASGYATSPSWVAASKATAELIEVPWSPSLVLDLPD